MKYRKQSHRYIYYDRESEGHIIDHDADMCLCGVAKEHIKTLAKRESSRLSTVTRFREEQGLCKSCQQVLKGRLKREYGLEDW